MAEVSAWRQVLLLSCLFGLSAISGTIVVAAASVVGLQLSGRAELATLPVALAHLGAMAATLPAAHVMAHWGRRTGFILGTLLAIVGAGLAVAGIRLDSFILFCAGSFALGTLAGVSSYYRFAAVEVTPPAGHARAIGFVLAGGVGAGLLGPPLGSAASTLWEGTPFAGSYLVMVLLGFLILLLLPFLRIPAPVRQVAASGRSLGAIARDPRFAASVLAAVTAFGAMVLTMVAAPLSLHHQGNHFAATAFVIQAHIVAMYAPSFFSGTLVARFGPGRVMAAGLALLAACVAVNLAGQSVPHHWVALVLLGMGWNLLFVAATTLLTRTHAPHEKARVQGFNDLVVATTGAAAALAAGPLHGAIGWVGVNLAVAGMVALCAAGLALLLGRTVAPTQPATPS